MEEEEEDVLLFFLLLLSTEEEELLLSRPTCINGFIEGALCGRFVETGRYEEEKCRLVELKPDVLGRIRFPCTFINKKSCFN